MTDLQPAVRLLVRQIRIDCKLRHKAGWSPALVVAYRQSIRSYIATIRVLRQVQEREKNGYMVNLKKLFAEVDECGVPRGWW